MLNHTYQEKALHPERFVSLLANVNNVILGMGAAMPHNLLNWLRNALLDREVNHLNLYYMHGSEHLKETLLQNDLKTFISPRPLFLSAYDRAAIKESLDKAWIEFIPSNFHQVGRLLTEQISPDCLMVRVSKIDKHGYFSLGTNADYSASVIRKAKKVFVEVNKYMPRTFGECTIHISEIDGLIENDMYLPEVKLKPASDSDKLIASHISEHIHDYDTLQMGVGGIPNAVLGLLENHQHLGLHTELFTPAMAHLISKGVLTGKKKSWMQHKHVFTLALGDKAMYDFMDDNPSIVGYPASWVNNPAIIQKNNNMVSVNAAIELDLTGQVNAEQVNGVQFSGTGGQLDFVRGAYMAKNGRSFIALHSTAKEGKISRIVPRIKNSTVTDTRMDTQFIVTENGCINLKGRSLVERAEHIIQLAHPSFQQALIDQAKEMGLLTSSIKASDTQY